VLLDTFTEPQVLFCARRLETALAYLCLECVCDLTQGPLKVLFEHTRFLKEFRGIKPQVQRILQFIEILHVYEPLHLGLQG
jgi:hypothetical protein